MARSDLPFRIAITINIALLTLNIILLGNNIFRSSPESQEHPLLSKRIFAESQNDILINFTPLRTAMREYVDKQSNQIGAYFEYLPSGTSIGINDQMEVKIASLIKVPVAMAVYKEIETGRLTPNQIIVLQQDHLDQSYGDLWKKGAGASLTISEAVNLAITKSDNTASRALVSTLPEGTIDQVFDALDIPKHKDGGFSLISPKNYTSILRSLYLSSYLDRESSSEILTVLTSSQFNDMIVAGVPTGINVAHKIGVYEQPDTLAIYSDCGIVYAPNRPYVLCIMAQGDEAAAKNQMQLLSKMVYGYVQKVSGN